MLAITATSFLEPQWLVFYVSLFLGFLFLVGSAFGLLGDGGFDHDHDINHDHDIDHDVHGEHGGTEQERGASSGNPLDITAHDTDRSDPFFLRLLGFFGIGKAPLSFVITTATLLFGATGVILNLMLEPLLKLPMLYGWISFIGAMFVALTLTGRIARLIGKYMPSTETYSVVKEEFLGVSGTLAVSTDTKYGLVQIQHGNGLHQLPCFLPEGELPAGREVLIIEFDGERNAYRVEAMSSATIRTPEQK